MIRDFAREHPALTTSFVTWIVLAFVLLFEQLDAFMFWTVLFLFAAAFILYLTLVIDSLIASHRRATASQDASWIGRAELGRTRRGWLRQVIGAARHGVPRRGKD